MRFGMELPETSIWIFIDSSVSIINKYLLLLFLFLLASIFGHAQTNNETETKNTKLNWFVTADIGVQMSGIKSEDFTSSNYSPLINIHAGKWLTPSFALQIGYKGWYFNTISDSIKHYYTFIYGEVIINSNALISKNYIPKIWSLFLHVGAGYFYNNEYNRPNICANLGITNNIRIIDNLLANMDISAIVGWDIYQGDADILPGLAFGITYLF